VKKFKFSFEVETMQSREKAPPLFTHVNKPRSGAMITTTPILKLEKDR